MSFPPPGVAVWANPHGIQIVRLHYSADPDKGDGEKTLVPELGLPLSSWAQYPIRPEVAPQPEGQQCHSQGQQSNCNP
jgi:hypothetical protein